MLGRSQVSNAVPKAASKTAAPKHVATTKTFTMKALWRLTVWGATAASALLLAVLTTRSEVGTQRMGIVLSSLSGGGSLYSSGPVATKVAAHSFDAEAETRLLAETVRNLKAENDRLKSRVAAVEHNVEDVTGSVTRQIEAVKTEAAPSWPKDEPVIQTVPAVIASVVKPVVPPPDGLSSPLPPNPLTPPARQPEREATLAPVSAGFGVDIGSALSIQVLRARWAGVRTAHPQLFEGLQPIVTLREIPRSNRAELRLVVGPLANADAAAQLCTALAAYRLFCQPTTFDGQHLALQ